MARIFISYKRKNREQVFSIVDRIESLLGTKCRVDLDGLENSLQFRSRICTAITVTAAVHRRILRDLRPVPTACTGVAAGTTMPGTAALLIAAGIRRTPAATATACASRFSFS